MAHGFENSQHAVFLKSFTLTIHRLQHCRAARKKHLL